MKDDLISKLKKLDIVYRKPVQLKHAGAAEFYIDVKKAYGYPDVLALISDSLWEMIDKETNVIATEGYGGLSPASILSLKYRLNLTLVRDQPKNHGKAGFIDGYIPNKGDKVSIIDDVFTTEASLMRIKEVINSTGAEILGCYVVVKRGEGELGIPLSYLLIPEDLV